MGAAQNAIHRFAMAVGLGGYWTDLLQALRLMDSQVGSASAQSGASGILYRPGAASSAMHVGTWQEVQAKIAATEGLLTVYVDTSVAPAHVPAASGTTDCEGRVELRPYANEGGAPVVLTVDDGARLLDLARIDGLLTLTVISATATGLGLTSGRAFVLANGAKIQNDATSTLPSLNLTGTGNEVILEDGAGLDNTPNAALPILDVIGAGATLAMKLYGGATVHAGSVYGSNTSTIAVTRESSCTKVVALAGYAGTLTDTVLDPAAVAILTFQPGGVDAPGIYTSFATLETAAQAITGPKIVVFDSTFGAVAIPARSAGSWNLGEVLEFRGYSPTSKWTAVQLAVGCSFDIGSLPNIWRDLDVSANTAAGAAVFATVAGDPRTASTSFIHTRIGAGGGDIIKWASDGELRVQAFDDSELGGTATGRVVNVPDNTVGFVQLELHSGSFLAAHSVYSDAAASAANADVFDPLVIPRCPSQDGAGVLLIEVYSEKIRLGAASLTAAGVAYLASPGLAAPTTQATAQIPVGNTRTVYEFRVWQNTAGAGAGNVVYQLQKNGASIAGATITLAANAASSGAYRAPVPISFSGGDLISIVADATAVAAGTPTNIFAEIQLGGPASRSGFRTVLAPWTGAASPR